LIFAAVSLAHFPASIAQQTTTGYCSPAIENVTGNVVTNCYTTVAALRKSVTDSLSDAIAAIQRLLTTQQYYMFPSLDVYAKNPSPETWKAAKHDIDLTARRVATATDAAIDYDASLKPQLGPNLSGLHNALRTRGGLLSQLPSEPPTADYLKDWISQYRDQVAKLQKELSALQTQLSNSPQPQ
jgi:hypothetical protein